MSEKQSFKPEIQETLPALPTAEQAEPLRVGEQDPVKALENARDAVSETVQAEKRPDPTEALNDSEKASQAARPTVINRDLRMQTKQRLQTRVQRQLSPPKRALSKVIHQPTIRVISEAASKTVSRPSGLLGGSIVAFLGSSSYLYIAKHIGFTYNYFVVILLLVGGFALGLVLELLVHLATASRNSRNNS